MTATPETQMLLALAVVIPAAQLAGGALARLGQPRVNGEILAGILLGPSALGAVWPAASEQLFAPETVTALRALAELGLVAFMFLVGTELDVGQLRGQGHRAVVVGHASIVVPFGLGVVLAVWLHPRLAQDRHHFAFVLFIGAAMAITALPVLARVLQETGLRHSRVGVLALTCAAANDLVAWCLLAGVVAMVQAAGLTDTLRTIGLSLAFLAILLGVVRPLLGRLAPFPVSAALAVALGGAWSTAAIGIHPVLGAFVAGVAMPRDAVVLAPVRAALEGAVVALLLPVFFTVVGLSTRVGLLDSGYLWAVALLVVAVAVAGKGGGALLAARLTGETWRDAAVLSVLLNVRGLTELVVLSVGLSYGVIDDTVFTLMVVMALATTLMATPVLALLARLAPRSGEVGPVACPADVEHVAGRGAGRFGRRLGQQPGA